MARMEGIIADAFDPNPAGELLKYSFGFYNLSWLPQRVALRVPVMPREARPGPGMPIGGFLVKTLMRFYSYLFHGLLALFLLAISLVPLFSGIHNLQLEMVPGEGETLTFTLMAIGILGVVTVLAAVMGKAQAPLFIWSVVVLLGMLYGYFWRPYRWSGPEAFQATLLLIFGAFLALLGAWYALQRRSARRQY
jgi:hypothetical protein